REASRDRRTRGTKRSSRGACKMERCPDSDRGGAASIGAVASQLRGMQELLSTRDRNGSLIWKRSIGGMESDGRTSGATKGAALADLIRYAATFFRDYRGTCAASSRWAAEQSPTPSDAVKICRSSHSPSPATLRKSLVSRTASSFDAA